MYANFVIDLFSPNKKTTYNVYLYTLSTYIVQVTHSNTCSLYEQLEERKKNQNAVQIQKSSTVKNSYILQSHLEKIIEKPTQHHHQQLSRRQSQNVNVEDILAQQVIITA